ncbi:hypothetical protein [Endothiovibrio diazotrophicus]
MRIELKSYIVAFIDLLGFSSMVTRDCETPNGEQKFIESLYECYVETKSLKKDYPDLQLIQFSDSVVFALPYSIENYISLVKLISSYQYNLLSKGILCRGGVSYGKHFSTEDFLFSNGMIEAYRLESQVANTPRVVIGDELLELVNPEIRKKKVGLPLIRERDGLWLINYLSGQASGQVWQYISKIVPEQLSESPSIRNKQVWLIDFYNHAFPDDARVALPNFSQ